MKDIEYGDFKHEIYNRGLQCGFEFDSIGEASLYYCELMLKRFAGYAVSHTEGQFFNSVSMLVRKDGRTPTKLGSRFLCSVYYKHSNLQSDGCVWAGRYREENK